MRSARDKKKIFPNWPQMFWIARMDTPWIKRSPKTAQKSWTSFLKRAYTRMAESLLTSSFLRNRLRLKVKTLFKLHYEIRKRKVHQNKKCRPVFTSQVFSKNLPMKRKWFYLFTKGRLKDRNLSKLTTRSDFIVNKNESHRLTKRKSPHDKEKGLLLSPITVGVFMIRKTKTSSTRTGKWWRPVMATIEITPFSVTTETTLTCK